MLLTNIYLILVLIFNSLNGNFPTIFFNFLLIYIIIGLVINNVINFDINLIIIYYNNYNKPGNIYLKHNNQRVYDP